MSEADAIRAEAEDALERVWFVKSIREERTDISLSLRLLVRRGLFVQVFVGERSGSLYMALIEGNRRVFGVDREAGRWHVHPFESPDQHMWLAEETPQKPLLSFLAKVEAIILEHDLL